MVSGDKPCGGGQLTLEIQVTRKRTGPESNGECRHIRFHYPPQMNVLRPGFRRVEQNFPNLETIISPIFDEDLTRMVHSWDGLDGVRREPHISTGDRNAITVSYLVYVEVDAPFADETEIFRHNQCAIEPRQCCSWLRQGHCHCTTPNEQSNGQKGLWEYHHGTPSVADSKPKDQGGEKPGSRPVAGLSGRRASLWLRRASLPDRHPRCRIRPRWWRGRFPGSAGARP